MMDPGAGQCPGEFRAAPTSGGRVLPPLSPAVYPPVAIQRRLSHNPLLVPLLDCFHFLWDLHVSSEQISFIPFMMDADVQIALHELYKPLYSRQKEGRRTGRRTAPSFELWRQYLECTAQYAGCQGLGASPGRCPPDSCLQEIQQQW